MTNQHEKSCHKLRDICIENLELILGKKQQRTVPESEAYTAFAEKARGYFKASLPAAGSEQLFSVFSSILPQLFHSLLRAAVSTRTFRNSDPREEIALLHKILKTFPVADDFQFMITRFFSAKHYAELKLEAPSIDIGIGDGLTSNIGLAGRKMSVGSTPEVSGLLHAKKNFGDHLRYEAIDATSIPYQNGTFKTLTAMNTIYHADNRAEVLAEMVRVLAPGGVLCFDDITSSFARHRPLSGMLKALGFPEAANLFIENAIGTWGGRGPADDPPAFYRRTLEQLGMVDIEIRPFLSPPLTALAYSFFDLDRVFQLQNPRQTPEAFLDNFKQTCSEVLAPLLADDAAICAETGESTLLLIRARKPAHEAQPVDERHLPLRWLCPACRIPMPFQQGQQGRLNCPSCSRAYPFINGDITLLIPFYSDYFRDHLPG